MPEPITYPKAKEIKEEKKKKLSDEEKEHKDDKIKKTKAEKEDKKPKKKRKTEETLTVPPIKKPKRELVSEDISKSPSIESSAVEPSPREKQLAEEIKEVLISKGKIQLSELVNIFKPKISGAEEKKTFYRYCKKIS